MFAIVNDNDSSKSRHGYAQPGRFLALCTLFACVATSPLYVLKEVFGGQHQLSVQPLHVHGVLSLLFWTVTLIVTAKYMYLALRADNRGEGGALALIALIAGETASRRSGRAMMMLGIVATALLYGDAVITPAITILSGTEGLPIIRSDLAAIAVPCAVAILAVLFLLEPGGLARVHLPFGTVMLVYMIVIAGLGLRAITQQPDIVGSLSPLPAIAFFLQEPTIAFFALGSIILAVTGVETLFAGMSGIGRLPIARCWTFFILPCLMLNYLGQGALLLDDPGAVRNPFFLLAPTEWQPPLVILAIAAGVVASHTVITSTFAVTRQAVQLGFLPRLRFRHVSLDRPHQIFVPTINAALLVLVVALTLAFGDTGSLASAYGVAVTGSMLFTTCLLGMLITWVWKWQIWMAAPVILFFVVLDGVFLASSLSKIADGGWVPLLIAAILVLLLTSWAKGGRLMLERKRAGSMPVEHFIASTASRKRVPGTAVFLSALSDGAPPALLHNLKHNKILHERTILLTIVVDDLAALGPACRGTVQDLASGFQKVRLDYGFAETIDVPRDLAKLFGDRLGSMETSYFLDRETFVPAQRPGMAVWRERLFAWMIRNSESATDYYRLPTNRVVELGSQVEL